jgi:hypothetical protein
VRGGSFRKPGRDYLRGLRAFLRPLAFGDDDVPAMRKSSSFLPDLIAAANHRGFNPRPAQVSAELSGFRYLGATFPQVPRPKADFDRVPPWKRVSFASSDSSVRRCSVTFPLSAAATRSRKPISCSTDIDFKFI